MTKRILIIAALLIMVFQGSASAAGLEGDIIFRDTLYGAAVGAIIGTAIYLIDQDNFGTKFGTGVVIGSLGGLAWGIKETRTFVEIEKDTIKIAFPTPVIQQKSDGVQYSASLFRAKF